MTLTLECNTPYELRAQLVLLYEQRAAMCREAASACMTDAARQDCGDAALAYDRLAQELKNAILRSTL